MTQPLQIVEIDLPYCTHVFGTSPCTAALSATVTRKCFNTRATCKDPANFNAGVLTLRFARNQSGLPAGMTVFPALQSVSTNPATINLSGVDPSTQALGKRARVTVTFLDFAYQDTLTDKYQAERVSGAAQFSGIGYNPARGAFFAKLLARQPYYVGLNLRVKNGYVGDALGAMRTQAYVISEWTGPDAAGVVTITAKDILDLAENTKAVAPALSDGKLAADIGPTDTTATLSPPGIGDLEYPGAGRACIGREVVFFTRSGDALIFTARALDGTVASGHSVNDQVQLCLRYEGNRIADVAANLFVAFAGIPGGYISATDWDGEEDSWMAGMAVTATITKPVGVTTLIGELCQLGVMIWWDDVAQQIRFRCNRPLNPGEVISPITDAAHILTGSVTVDQSEDQRISALICWHGMIDPTGSATDASNFSKAAVSSVTENLYGQDAIKEIFTRWFGQTGDDVNAGIIAARLVGRYKDTPKRVTATVDVKDRDSVDLGDLISVQTRQIQDPTGFVVPHQMQVNSSDQSNEQVTFIAETYSIQGRFGYWMQDPQPDYSTATDDEKSFGAFWMDNTIGVFSDGSGPYVWF